MRMSIITVVYNRVSTIRNTIESVLSQSYKNIEHIIIDGGSTDGTLEVILKYESLVCLSEPDSGIYDAMNKGIQLATGDLVGILNSDDVFYSDDVISKIVAAFQSTNVDATIGNVEFVSDNNQRVLRNYSSRNWSTNKFSWGFMPPHPSFFVRRSMFDIHGYYNVDYSICGDYDLLIRYLHVHKLNWVHLDVITTKMHLGGVSTKGFSSLITLNREILKACKANGVHTNYFMIYSKYIKKFFEFI